MHLNHLLLGGLAIASHSHQAKAQTNSASAAGSCPTVLTSSNYDRPVVGSGYTAQLVVTGLTKPRGLIFDQSGALLVVESGVGITRIRFDDRGGTCLLKTDSPTIHQDSSLNHGIELSPDGQTLYASSSSDVYSWPYTPETPNLGSKRTLITNMSNSDHTTRTLLLSRKSPGLLLVSRGSSENIDEDAASISSGHSQIRVFNISSLATDDNSASPSPFNYATDGQLLGWGLRNSVGVAEHPVTGGVYSVENSADQLNRAGTDVHQDNPGEEMNFHGYLNNTASLSSTSGPNFGYPHCFALWDTENFPEKGDMKIGSQFVLDPDNGAMNDATCAQEYVSPRLTFQAHMAPLDIKFTSDGGLAYVSFHGSWNRDEPVGYKLSAVSFDAMSGEPVEAADSGEAAVDILSNADNDKCPGGCFRPAGIAIDGQGRVFMSSDATGEIYVLQRAEMTASGGGGDAGKPSTTAGGGTLVTSTAAPTSSPNAAATTLAAQGGGWLVVTLTLALSVIGGTVFVAA